MPNRLASETSPYLRQHKDNPVDWYPWGPEAFARAKADGKPVLLSVGYAACHWCHVMAHESFEDASIAALMNGSFVNIKLDREERPDLDSIYQNALALMGQQGGWPLTMFLTPEGKPFAAGTYYPPEPRYGRASFPQVLTEVARVWREEPERVRSIETTLMPQLENALNPTGEGEITLATLDQIAARLVKAIDPVFGGVGNAPKFPNTPILEFLWRAYLRTGDESYAAAVETSLVHMCQGGIYDHVGGGFARYSVDRPWLTPHFEKMLYDNAQLVSLMTLVWRKTRSALLAARIDETIQWVMREMRIGGKAFAASLDADSDGHEGRFYVWSKAEIADILGTDDLALFCSVYGVTEEGNFEGLNILNRLGALELGDEAHEMRLRTAREKLLAVRAKRIRPARDDKILAEWNGLMIKALAEAGAAFGRSDWIVAALRALAAVAPQAVDAAHLYRTSGGESGGLPGLAEDYANLIAASLAVQEATRDEAAPHLGEGWAATLAAEFSAPGGGFFQSGAGASDVIVRSRTIFDNAVPPANATMIANYARLYAQTGREDFRQRGEAIIRHFSGVALQSPSGTATFLNAFELFLVPISVFIVAPEGGPKEASKGKAERLIEAAFASPNPNTMVFWASGQPALQKGHPAEGKVALGGETTAYVCRGPVCSAPVTGAAALTELLQA